MKVLLAIIISLPVILTACQNKPNSTSGTQIEDHVPVEQGKNYIDEEGPKSFIPASKEAADETRKIKDGSYTADVEYYNITTGANTLYVTKVQVEDGYLKVIKWPNGVWLASTYFKPQKIRQDGTCIISNIEAGYENRVRILDLEYY